MRALIVDDEFPALAALRGLLGACPEVTHTMGVDTMGAAKEALRAGDYDVVFLDIQLWGGNGFDLVPLVRPGARIIFVTAFNRYAVRAFEVNALDYLIKPIRLERLVEALRRLEPMAVDARTSTAPSLLPSDFVHLKTGNGTTRFIALADIAMIESHENYSQAYLANGARLFVRRTMKTWEDTLPATHFVRVHRTRIINIARYRGSERQSYETTLLNVEGVSEPVRASFRYLPSLNARLDALRRIL